VSPVRVVLRVIRVLRVEALYAGLLASLALTAYLFFVLARPERF